MPMHDWTMVESGIYHAFHHRWISSLSDSLNSGVLPKDYYALPEQMAAGFGPDILTLQSQRPAEDADDRGTALRSRPRTRFTAESESEFYRRKQSAVAIRHVSDDEIVAMIEIVSHGNRSGRKAFRQFVDKACELLEHRIHLLIVDPFPPGARDPNGIHAAIWDEIAGDEFRLPSDKRLTLVAYERDLPTRAYIEPNGYVDVPLEATYQSAFSAMPRRWRDVLEPGSGAS
jgi:hypothetical protein